MTSLLLLASSIMVLYLNRSLIFEHRSSASQMRAASAHEIAEAGLEWTIGMLNHSNPITAGCDDIDVAESSERGSFRSRYVAFPTSGAPDYLPVTATAAPAYPSALPGCSINALDASLSCSCPTAGSAALDLTTAAPHFSLHLEPERDIPDATDPTKFHWETVRITAIGCTAAASICRPPSAGVVAASRKGDATAIVSMAVKLRPVMLGGTFAALTCGADCKIDGPYKIVNTSMASNGLLINAGGDITSSDQTSYQTIPGTPVTNALVAHEKTLSSLSRSDPTCADSAVFQAYFGSSIEQYRDAPATKVIECSSPTQCGANIQRAYTEGVRAFYFSKGVELTSSSGFPADTLGTSTEPVILVTPKRFSIDGDITINGVVFSNNPNGDDLETGTANINGAIIACGEFKGNGSSTLRYDDLVMTHMRRSNSYLVKVPGSWRDWSSP